MNNLILDSTKYTPSIELNINGTITITGKSYPENTFAFYAPIMEWIKTFLETKEQEVLILNMEIIYFNSSSSKLFFDLFDLLDEHNSSVNININWIYHKENDSAEEAGEDFIEDFDNLNIILVEKE